LYGTTFAFSVIGFCLGLALSGAAARGPWQRRAAAALLSGLLGASAGAGAGWVAKYVEQHHFRGREVEMAEGMLLQGIGWSLLAAGVGVGVGLTRAGLPGVPQAACGAVLGGIAASMLYIPAAGFLYVSDFADHVFPEGFLSEGSTNHLFWTGLAGGVIGLAVSASITVPGAPPTGKAEPLPPEIANA
jgi:hypothetical protein